MVQLVTHEKLLERRDKLKAKGFDKFLEYKARRYAFFRAQNFINGGAMADAEHWEIVKEIEKEIEPLGGVKQFAIVWDLDPLTGKVIRRDISVWQAHDNVMRRSAVQLFSENGKLVAEQKQKRKK